MSKIIPNGNTPVEKVLTFSDSVNLKPNRTLSSASTELKKSPSNQSVSSQNYSNILKSVGKKIRKTKAELDRSGWIHAFYILSLVVYGALGGALFCALDGAASDKTIERYDHRCVDRRERLWHELITNCQHLSFEECQNETRLVLMTVDNCLRIIDRNITVYSTAKYMNSVIYAITVFTTIGYGTITVSSTAGRAATVIYTIIGAPLFFAFLNDMGQWFQRLFLIVYVKLRRLMKRTSLYKNIYRRKSSSAIDVLNYEDSPSKTGLIFTSAVIFLILYFLMVSTMFTLIEDWNFFNSFYFVFQSISLIGFGDVFPDHPNTVLFTIIFIIVGISLLSMCFFILQEWIREKTSRLSNRFRYSVRLWRETHHFTIPHYHIPNGLWSSRSQARHESAVPELCHKVSFTTPNSLSASRENSPTMTRTNSLNFQEMLKFKRNSLGAAVVAGRFQFVADDEQRNSDESD